jgi:hypothetical protein
MSRIVTIKPQWGSTIQETLFQAQNLARRNRCVVNFQFNQVKCNVSEQTDLVHLYRDYKNATWLDLKEIGPDCDLFILNGKFARWSIIRKSSTRSMRKDLSK